MSWALEGDRFVRSVCLSWRDESNSRWDYSSGEAIFHADVDGERRRQWWSNVDHCPDMPGRGLPCSLISALSRPSFPSPYRYCVWGYWATVSSLSAVRGKLRGVVGTFGWLFDGMGKGLRPMIYLRGCKPMVDLSRPGLLFLGKGWWRCWVASFAL